MQILQTSLGIVTQEKTLFTYHAGKNYSSFVDFDFTPVFLDDTSSLFTNSTLEAEARDLCGGNEECFFDVAMTGRTSVGEATLEYFIDLQERTNYSQIGMKVEKRTEIKTRKWAFLDLSFPTTSH